MRLMTQQTGFDLDPRLFGLPRPQETEGRVEWPAELTLKRVKLGLYLIS